VTTIGPNAFERCSSLSSITFNNRINDIREYAFRDCRCLTSIYIPNSVMNIGIHTFAGTNALASIIVDCDNPVYDSREGCNAIIKTSDNELVVGCKDTNIPKSVISIGYAAFAECKSLSSIYIPNSVTSIKTGAFDRCSGLTSIIVEGGNPIYDSREGCNAIIRTSENELVIGCIKTKILNSVAKIGNNAFMGCSSLTSIKIPNSITAIGSWAFFECTSLTDVTLPESVTFIGGSAFAWCKSLKDFYCHAESVPKSSDLFYNSPINNATLHVPQTSISEYKSSPYWSGFKEIVALTDQEMNIKGKNVEDEMNHKPIKWYQLNGQNSSGPKQGLNIIRMSNGKSKKVIVK